MASRPVARKQLPLYSNSSIRQSATILLPGHWAPPWRQCSTGQTAAHRPASHETNLITNKNHNKDNEKSLDLRHAHGLKCHRGKGLGEHQRLTLPVFLCLRQHQRQRRAAPGMERRREDVAQDRWRLRLREERLRRMGQWQAHVRPCARKAERRHVGVLVACQERRQRDGADREPRPATVETARLYVGPRHDGAQPQRAARHRGIQRRHTGHRQGAPRGEAGGGERNSRIRAEAIPHGAQQRADEGRQGAVCRPRQGDGDGYAPPTRPKGHQPRLVRGVLRRHKLCCRRRALRRTGAEPGV